MSKLLPVTEMIIQHMEADPEAFDGGKFADLGAQIRALPGKMAPSLVMRGAGAVSALPDADRAVLIAAYQRLVSAHELTVYVTQVAMGAKNGAESYETKPVYAAVGGGGGGTAGVVGAGGAGGPGTQQATYDYLRRKQLLPEDLRYSPNPFYGAM